MDNLQKLSECISFCIFALILNILLIGGNFWFLTLLLVNALTEISQLTSSSRDGLNQKEASKLFQKHIPPLPQESGQRHSSPSHGYATAQIHLGRQVSSPIPTHSYTILNTSTALSSTSKAKQGDINHPQLIKQGVFNTRAELWDCQRKWGKEKKKPNLLTRTMIKCFFCSYSQEGDWDNIPSIWGNVPSSKHSKPLPPCAHPQSPPHTRQQLKFSLGEN